MARWEALPWQEEGSPWRKMQVSLWKAIYKRLCFAKAKFTCFFGGHPGKLFRGIQRGSLGVPLGCWALDEAATHGWLQGIFSQVFWGQDRDILEISKVIKWGIHFSWYKAAMYWYKAPVFIPLYCCRYPYTSTSESWEKRNWVWITSITRFPSIKKVNLQLTTMGAASDS